MFGLHCTGWQVAGETVICESSVTATREGSPLVQLKMAPYIEIWYAFSGGAGGGPAQKFGLFVTAGAGQRQVLRTDCLPILNKPHPYSPKTKEHMSHAINPPSCGKKGGGHKNVCVSKTLRCVSQRKLAHKQNIGISTRKLALWPRKRWVSGGISNSLRPCEMKDLFSTAHIKRCSDLGYNQPHAPS